MNPRAINITMSRTLGGAESWEMSGYVHKDDLRAGIEQLLKLLDRVPDETAQLKADLAKTQARLDDANASNLRLARRLDSARNAIDGGNDR